MDKRTRSSFHNPWEAMGYQEAINGSNVCCLMIEEHRKRWERGNMKGQEYVRANAALVEAERVRKARSLKGFEKGTETKPKGPRKHPHGSDW